MAREGPPGNRESGSSKATGTGSHGGDGAFTNVESTVSNSYAVSMY